MEVTRRSKVSPPFSSTYTVNLFSVPLVNGRGLANSNGKTSSALSESPSWLISSTTLPSPSSSCTLIEEYVEVPFLMVTLPLMACSVMPTPLSGTPVSAICMSMLWTTFTSATNTALWFSFSLTKAMYMFFPAYSLRSMLNSSQSPLSVPSELPGERVLSTTTLPSVLNFSIFAASRSL